MQPETRYARLGIVFDRRGTGASDPQLSGSLPPWEAYAQDLTAVLDEVGSQQAALLAQFDQLWGTEAMAAMFAPSRAGDQRFCRWFARLQRAVASPRVVQAFLRANLEMDARPILPLIQAPTLVLHRRDYQFIPIANGRYLAERISGARVVELDGTEQSLFWETPEAVLDHIERFLTGMRRGVQPTRTLATVLFTDIVSSTERAEELGDRRWRELLNVHDELTGRNQRPHPLGAGAGAACDQPMAPQPNRPRRRSRGCDRTDWSGGVGHDWLSCSTPPGLEARRIVSGRGPGWTLTGGERCPTERLSR